MKVQSYDIRNIGFFYLSPYVEHRIEGDYLIFYQTLFDRTETFEIKEAGQVTVFLERMSQGLNEEACVGFIDQVFRVDNPSESLIVLMQSGIIE